MSSYASNARSPNWTVREDAVLHRISAGEVDFYAAQALLPGRSVGAMKTRAGNLRLDMRINRRNLAPELVTNIRKLDYMSSETAVAAYLECSVDDVRRVRAQRGKPRDPGTRKDLTTNEPVGSDTFFASIPSASNILLTRTLSLYDRHAKAHRTTREAAMLTLNHGAAAAARFIAHQKENSL